MSPRPISASPLTRAQVMGHLVDRRVLVQIPKNLTPTIGTLVGTFKYLHSHGLVPLLSNSALTWDALPHLIDYREEQLALKEKIVCPLAIRPVSGKDTFDSAVSAGFDLIIGSPYLSRKANAIAEPWAEVCSDPRGPLLAPTIWSPAELSVLGQYPDSLPDLLIPEFARSASLLGRDLKKGLPPGNFPDMGKRPVMISGHSQLLNSDTAWSYLSIMLKKHYSPILISADLLGLVTIYGQGAPDLPSRISRSLGFYADQFLQASGGIEFGGIKRSLIEGH